MNVLLVLLIHLETFELTYLFRHILHSLHERVFHHASLNQTSSTTIFCLLLIPLLPELYEWELSYFKPQSPLTSGELKKL